MMIQSASTVPVDPARIERAGVGSVAIAQAPPAHDQEIESSPKPVEKEKRSADEIRKDLEVINEQLKTMNQSIRFSVDDKSTDVVVRIVDKDTDEIIRQIPPESVVRFRDNLARMSGLFIAKKV